MASSADLARLEILTDAKARNALALELGDARVPGLSEVLIRLIERPDLREQRGTLIHVLGFQDCSSHLPLLAKLVAEGNWEVAHEAFEIIDTLETADDRDVEAAQTLVRSALGAGASDAWRRELLEDALGLLD